jgi:hypothetical protein
MRLDPQARARLPLLVLAQRGRGARPPSLGESRYATAWAGRVIGATIDASPKPY